MITASDIRAACEPIGDAIDRVLKHVVAGDEATSRGQTKWDEMTERHHAEHMAATKARFRIALAVEFMARRPNILDVSDETTGGLAREAIRAADVLIKAAQ